MYDIIIIKMNELQSIIIADRLKCLTDRQLSPIKHIKSNISLNLSTNYFP